LEVRAVCGPLPGDSFKGTFSGGVNIPLQYKWICNFQWLNKDGTFIRSSSVIQDPPAPGFERGNFPVSLKRCCLSDDNPTYSNPCLFAGGFWVETIGVFFNVNYLVFNNYWGRVYLQITVES
jgi:hypothetical protein